MIRLSMAVAFPIIAMFFVGCSDGPKDYEVTGEVKFKGEPVQAGTVRFEPTGAGGRPGEGFITDGKYSVKVMPGDYKVEIRSPREVKGPANAGPGADSSVETIPAKYNSATTLTAAVADDKLQHDFVDLK